MNQPALRRKAARCLSFKFCPNDFGGCGCPEQWQLFFNPYTLLAHMKKTTSKKSIEGWLLLVLLLAGLYGAMSVLRGQDEQPALASPGGETTELVMDDSGF